MPKKKKKEEENVNKMDVAMSNLKKKYGNDVLMQMDKNIDFKVEWVPTGCFSLDQVIGKGLPRGRVIELFGAESSGKSTMSLFLMSQIQKNGGKVALVDAENCIDESTEIFNPLTGEIKKIKDIYKDNKETNVMSFDKKIIKSTVIGKKKTKKQDGLEIILDNNSIKCTKDHMIYTYHDGWKDASKITTKDYIATIGKIDLWGNKNKIKEAKLLGYMLGDGYITGKGNSLHFSVKDELVKNDLETIVNKFGSTLKKASGKDKYGHRIVEKTQGGKTDETVIQKIFSNWGLRGKKSNDKFIPKEVFSDWNKKSISNLISSLWMTDGTVNNNSVNRNTLAYSSTSIILVKQLQHLLLRFGIKSKITEYKDKRKDSYFTQYKLTINGYYQLLKFNNEIELIGDKKEKIESNLKKTKNKCYLKSELLPGYKDHRKIKNFINDTDISWGKVKKINKTTVIPYDISVQDYHNFFANNILVHNCFDGEYASNIGLDISKLLLAQPESMEESMDIIKELVESETIDIIVIDSVSALVPKSEVEGEDFMKDTMAIQARLMSRALRILSGPISKSKTVVIFINQIRDKVGVFYGSKTTTSGGRALKFFSSVRLQVAKGKKIEKSDVQIGNQIIVTAVKNKVGFPFKQTTLDLYYARGLDLVADALDFGEENGIIKKSGLTYSFGETILGAGRAKARNKLVEDEKLFKEVTKSINKFIKENNDDK